MTKMDNYKGNKQDVTMQRNNSTTDELARTPAATFEYSFPMNDAEGDDSESNKSTPYYTPLEFFHSTFEFPSPRLEKSTYTKEETTSPAAGTENVVASCSEHQNSEVNSKLSTAVPSTPKSFTTITTNQMQSSSPVVNRKLRRFSLYERRSCSPQHFLIKSSTASVDNSALDSAEYIDDKENAKPLFVERKEHEYINIVSNSGNNSPITLQLDETGSPKVIISSSEANTVSGGRATYSPKLLASLNNINLSGSPLGVISSAGYKNGNYFKFPEIDHVVQDLNMPFVEELPSGNCNIEGRNKQKYINSKFTNLPATLQTTLSKRRNKNSSADLENAKPPASGSSDLEFLSRADVSELKKSQTELCKPSLSIAGRPDCRKSRKNKNNLTIKITDVPMTQSSPPKPKTPTIKTTKEKALSLDSAAGEGELTIIISNRNEAHGSYDEIDAQAFKINTNQCRQVGERRQPEFCVRNSAAASNRSTSLSQLSSYTEAQNLCANTSSKLGKSLGNTPLRLGDALSSSNLTRTPRRRIPGSASNDWFYHRKQYPYNLTPSMTTDTAKKSFPETDCEIAAMGEVVVLKEDDEAHCEDSSNLYSKYLQNTSNNVSITSPSTSTLSTPHRGIIHKHNPLLHSSNTNLKTLPEFLTLVEFTPSNSKENLDYPYKQKSIDLPSSIVTTGRTKTIASTSSASSTNLLQRRGSNHSLTINLHGSCSNLLGNCRSGLSVSNYSLGSVGNSTTNLNSKSSCNLDLSTSNTPQIVSIIHPNVTNTQGAKQSLFRRRGSNHSLTLTNLTATSCGNLNSFASQNSLNIDTRSHLTAGVTRTTSFITSTSNTASSVTPKRGLLERRGSNQSLTLNMGGSFGGVGAERSNLAISNLYLGDAYVEDSDAQQKNILPTCCSQTHHRKFFSSENLNKANTQFSDLNQTHKRNANQVCFGSVSDLKPSEYKVTADGQKQGAKRDHFDFPESAVCTCTGVRNIMTRPLSPQTTSEEFKVYLANVQMLQNASNALNQIDLIKLNYIFDNSYTSNNKSIANQALPVLGIHGRKEAETPPGITSTSEDCEVAERFQQVVHMVLDSMRPDEDEQKRIFCDLHKEFWDLPLNHQEKPMVFGSQTKNRYKTILPNENSRFILEKECKLLTELVANIKGDEFENFNIEIAKQSHAAEEVPYINANYIKGPDFTSKCYVATQGPLPNTIYEFWLMIYQNTQKHLYISNEQFENVENVEQYCQKIVMLTNFLENNRQKCSIYFPVELHEILVVTAKQEPVHAADELAKFFNVHLTQNDDAQEAHSNDEDTAQLGRIEIAKVQLNEDLCKIMPAATTFFILKNIGIVRKNGFSIRKLIVLYCSNLPTKANDNSTQLVIQKFCCYHYWYPDWPDHRSPRDINTLLDICLHVLNMGKCEAEFEIFNVGTNDEQQKHIEAQRVELFQQDILNSVQPAPVIHCSAGIGRTGCFTAILNGIRQLRQSFAYSLITMAAAASATDTQAAAPVDFCLPPSYLNEIESCNIEFNNDTDSSFTRNTLLYINFILQKNTKDVAENSLGKFFFGQLPSLSELPHMPNIFVDILGIVCNLRLQRGGMVQNSEQYELIHRAICLYLKRTFALKRF